MAASGPPFGGSRPSDTRRRRTNTLDIRSCRHAWEANENGRRQARSSGEKVRRLWPQVEHDSAEDRANGEAHRPRALEEAEQLALAIFRCREATESVHGSVSHCRAERVQRAHAEQAWKVQDVRRKCEAGALKEIRNPKPRIGPRAFRQPSQDESLSHNPHDRLEREDSS